MFRRVLEIVQRCAQNLCKGAGWELLGRRMEDLNKAAASKLPIFKQVDSTAPTLGTQLNVREQLSGVVSDLALLIDRRDRKFVGAIGRHYWRRKKGAFRSLQAIV